MSVAQRGRMPRSLLASLGLLVACTTYTPPVPPDVPTGPLQLNDVSILFPLSTTYLSASSSGARGALVPESLYDSFGGITGSTFGPDDDDVGHADYGDLHAVAMRIDPCFAALDPDPQGFGCTAQLRLVFQEVRRPDTSMPPSAFDSGLHAFYQLSRADLLQLAHDIAAFRAASSTGRLGALAIHPLFARDGESGEFASGVRGLILEYAGAQNLTRLARLSSLGDRTWAFNSDDVGDRGQLTALPIPSLAGSAAQQFFLGGDGDVFTGGYEPSTTSSDDLTALAGLGEPTAEAQTAFAALVRIDNPRDHSATTIDCESCHTATPLSRYNAAPTYGLVEATAPGAFQADGTYVLASELTPTFDSGSDFPFQLHAFSYLDTTPEIDQRVVNESAAVVVYLNHALGL